SGFSSFPTRRSSDLAVIGNLILVWLGAPRGLDAFGRKQVLGAVRNTVQRASTMAAADLGVGALGLFESAILGQSDHAVHLRRVRSEEHTSELQSRVD